MYLLVYFSFLFSTIKNVVHKRKFRKPEKPLLLLAVDSWINRFLSFSFRRLLQMGVYNAELFTNLGLCCFFAQQYDMTLNCFERALSLASDENMSDVWYNIGHIAVVKLPSFSIWKKKKKCKMSSSRKKFLDCIVLYFCTEKLLVGKTRGDILSQWEAKKSCWLACTHFLVLITCRTYLIFDLIGSLDFLCVVIGLSNLFGFGLLPAILIRC